MKYFLLIILLLLPIMVSAKTENPTRVYTVKADTVEVSDFAILLKKITALEKRVKELEKNE